MRRLRHLRPSEGAAMTALGLQLNTADRKQPDNVFDGGDFYVHKAMGLVDANFSRRRSSVNSRPRGHRPNRYSTTGEASSQRAADLCRPRAGRFRHRAQRQSDQRSCDHEDLVQRDRCSSQPPIPKSSSILWPCPPATAVKLTEAVNEIKGVTVLSPWRKTCCRVRDPFGIRPLVLGKQRILHYDVQTARWISARSSCAMWNRVR